MPDGLGAPGCQTLSEDLVFGLCRLGESQIAIPTDALSEVCQISSLARILIRSDGLSGGIDLRGQLIPVINLPAICGLADRIQPAPFAVVLRQDTQHLAILVDQVLGITTVAADRIQNLSHRNAAPGAAVVRQVLVDRGQTTSVIDVGLLFSLPGVLSVRIEPQAPKAAAQDGRAALLTFAVGGAQFSVDAADVYSTVPRQRIDRGAMTSGFCLGSITYHQRRIPVLDTADLLGLGCRLRPETSEVVVLRFPHDRLIGLAVDAIQDIQRIDLARHAKVPTVLARQNAFLTRVVMRADGEQIFVLSADQLQQAPGIAAIASLSTSSPEGTPAAGKDATAGGEKFLVIQAGRPFAVPLVQVSAIIPVPAALVPAAPKHGLNGFFPRPPYSVPMFTLVELLGLSAGAADTERVLLIGEREDQIGVKVERVFSIEAARWTLEGLRTQGPGAQTLVQLGHGAARRAVPVLDIAALVAARVLPEVSGAAQ